MEDSKSVLARADLLGELDTWVVLVTVVVIVCFWTPLAADEVTLWVVFTLLSEAALNSRQILGISASS